MIGVAPCKLYKIPHFRLAAASSSGSGESVFGLRLHQYWALLAQVERRHHSSEHWQVLVVGI
jgi:hypothetical protein